MKGQSLDRWLVTGTITLRSALRIRTGLAETNDARPEGHVGTPPQEGDVLAIDLDARNRPFLAGTGLKGAIRAWLAARYQADSDTSDRLDVLFGRYPKPVEIGDRTVDVPLGGRFEFLNAYLAANAAAAPTPIRGRTRIDRKTRTAEHGMLRHERVVAPDAVFKVEVMADCADEADIKVLLEGLGAIRADGPITLGGGKGSGHGVAEWKPGTICRMDPNAIAAWLDDPEPRSWRDAIDGHKLDDAARARLLPAHDAESPAASGLALSAKVRLKFEGLCLVAQPGAKPKTDADLVPVRTAGEWGSYFLPGTSVRGALRSQAERIVRTLFPGQATETKSDDLSTPVERLFGKAGWRGALAVGDFIIEDKTQKLVHHEMVAIDRFTGGARDGAKFKFDVLERPIFEGTVTLHLGTRSNPPASGIAADTSRIDPIDAAALGLLALLTRDLIEGDVVIGHGATKGYGACTAAIEPPSSLGHVPAKLADILGLKADDIGDLRSWTAEHAGLSKAVEKALEALRAWSVPATRESP